MNPDELETLVVNEVGQTALEFFSERFIQRLAIRDFSHDLAPLKYT